jgi:hypothetical protein
MPLREQKAKWNHGRVGIIVAAAAASCHLLPGNVEDLSYVSWLLDSDTEAMKLTSNHYPQFCKKALYLPGYVFEHIGDMGWVSRADGWLKW